MRTAVWLGGARVVAASIAALTTPAVFLASVSTDESASLAHATAVMAHVSLTPPHAVPDGPPWGP